MPAMSRSGEERGPALGQRPGRLALEVEQHPAGVGAHDLPEVVVAVDALDGRPGPAARRAARVGVAEPVRVSAPARARPRVAARACRHRLGQRRASASVGARRCERARPASACTSAVAVPSRSDSPAKSPPDLVRRAGRPRANRSRTLASASFQPSVPARRNASTTARSWSSPSTPASRASPPARRRASLPLGERAGDLEIGVEPGGDAAEHLEDVRVSEDQAGVATARPASTRCPAAGRRRARDRRRPADLANRSAPTARWPRARAAASW